MKTLENKFDKDNNEKGVQKLINEKEEELEKINYQNASYRAQLIELKISMTKTRDAHRFSVKEDENVIKVNDTETQLEDAKEQMKNQAAKIKEQDSIIETLLAQTHYYKSKYEDEV